MHQSLYRKYRPTNFDEVVGQKIIIQTLKNALKNNTLSHAYLFAGPRGTGKTSIAKILAKTVNCENINDYNPCNKCVNCTQYNNKQAVDIIEIDAASNNGVEEIRELKSKINLVPTIGKYKIYIIDEVHMLSTGAFNALLKTLEEPPKHIIFVLATTDPHKIPSTILSRCQRFDFKKIDSKYVIERLKEVSTKENIDIDADALEELAYLSDGGMRDALSLLDQAIAYANGTITLNDIHEINGTITNKTMKEFLNFILNKEIEKIFNQIDYFNSEGKDFYKLTEEFVLYLRNILIHKNVPNYFKVESENYNIDIDIEELIDMIKEFNNSLYEMKTSTNPRLIFELAIIKIINKNDSSNVQVVKEKIINKEISEKSISAPSKENKVDINKLNKIRINNTLCNFNKKEYIDFKNNIDNLKKYLIDSNYSEFISLILDGEIKAFGKNNFIIVYDNSKCVEEFNKNFKMIDEIFEKEYKQEIKGTAVDKTSWEQIKTEFNNKEKKYEYINEKEEINV